MKSPQETVDERSQGVCAPPAESSPRRELQNEALIFASGISVLTLVPFMISIVAVRSNLVTTIAEALGSL